VRGASALLTQSAAPDYAVPTAKGGKLPYKGLIGVYPHFAADTLASRARASLKTTFNTRGHYPSPEMWSALEAVLRAMEAMADGTCEPLVYLSSLDPGVGKTTAVIHFLRELLASDAHRHVAVLVCVKRLDQIKAIVAEATLADKDFAVLTASKEHNALGCGSPSGARILFTTHQMVETRCGRRLFRNVAAFHYHGHPRAVRIWDEAILPGRPLTMPRDDLAFLLRSLRSPLPALAGDVEKFFLDLGAVKDGATITVPDFAEKHSVGLNDMLGTISKGQDAEIGAIECLWFLSGKVVTIRKDGNRGNTMLDYQDTLPDDFKPVLALDASGRVRTAYRFWEERRGGIEMLPSAPKRYDNLTIHVWRRGGGKDAFRQDGDRLAEGAAATIATKPQEPWLIIHHKAGAGINFEADVRALLPDGGPNVHFLHWGAHDATNSYAHIPNVILAGTLFYRTSHYEALGRLVSGQPSSDGAFEEADRSEIMLGEHRNLVLLTCH
jgi:hypothetical protein